MHRSVKEFLQQEDIQDLLWKEAGADFHPEETLCRLYLALSKRLCIADPDVAMNTFRAIADEVLCHAKSCEEDGITGVSTLLQRRWHWDDRDWELVCEVDGDITTMPAASGSSDRSTNHVEDRGYTLDDVGYFYNEARLCKIGQHWVNSDDAPGDCDFLAYAVSYGLCHFVQGYLKDHPESFQYRHGRPLLYYALIPRAAPGQYQLLSSQLEMARLLLLNGADPNAEIILRDDEVSTVWRSFLASCQRSPRGNCVELGVLLLEYGADPDVLVRGPSQTHLSAREWRTQSNVQNCFLSCTALDWPSRDTRHEIEVALKAAKARKKRARSWRTPKLIEYLAD